MGIEEPPATIAFKASERGDRDDCRFFERNPGRWYRVRKAIPGEFDTAATHALVRLDPNYTTGNIGTMKIGATLKATVPGTDSALDSDRSLAAVWAMIEARPSENQRLELHLDADLLQRIAAIGG